MLCYEGVNNNNDYCRNYSLVFFRIPCYMMQVNVRDLIQFVRMQFVIFC